METFSQSARTDCGSRRHSRDITAARTVHSQPEGSVQSIDEPRAGPPTPTRTNCSPNVPGWTKPVDPASAVLSGHSCEPSREPSREPSCEPNQPDQISDSRCNGEQEAMDDDDVADGDLVMRFQGSSPPTLTQLAQPAPSTARPSPPSGASSQGDNSSKPPMTCQIRPELGSTTMAAGCTPGPGVRSMPIHCVVELTSPDVGCCRGSQVLLDTFAILPGATPLSELVKTSLLRLGYSPAQTAGAKGGIQLKNWKTLTFDVVTDQGQATVEEILGEITSVATLRISLSSTQTDSKPSSEPSKDPIKDRLLQLLLTKSIDFLVHSGCPVEKSLLEAISTGEAIQSISEQVVTSFNDWYKMAHGQNETYAFSPLVTSTRTTAGTSLSEAVLSETVLASRQQVSPSVTSQPKAQPLAARAAGLAPGSPLNLDIKREQSSLPADCPVKVAMDPAEAHQFPLGHKESDSVHKNRKLVEKLAGKNCLQSELLRFSRSPSEGNVPSSNPYLGLMPGKTRIRTSFDPEQEIPRLQKWFSSNQHPTREQMVRFMHELNGLESRKGRRPLDLTNIIYWFKNARAAQRRATRVLDDSFENEENVDMNSAESGNSTTDSVPPFLPNKNAVYMIPFHPYTHLIPGSGPSDGSHVTSGLDIDEPYDLSLSKQASAGLTKIRNGKVREENNFLSLSTSPSPTKSSSTSSECESQGSLIKKKKTYCPPRFPALLDVACKMRQEIPLRSEDIYFNSNTNMNNHNGCRGSPYRSGSGSSIMEHSGKNEEMDSNYSNPSTPLGNGDCGGDQFSAGLKIKKEDDKYLDCEISRKSCQHSSHTSRDSGLELGQMHKEEEGKMNSSDDDDDGDETNDSYNSEEELKLRYKQNAAVVDYASAMHNNVSRLTAANMAALSLAQMGQPLHIPQLTSSLAMAYYPMDPRFYSQPTVQHSLTTSSPTSLTNTHSSHLAQLSLRQSHDSRLESRSPLPSPSIMQQSLTQLNHHHHHHQHHQQQSPQQHHQRHNSEPRKRRTRVFIDPLTEIPKLEKWFTEDTHPSAFMIDKYCEELNKCEYRHKFPKLEPKNIQLWFKNHRAKVKRLKVSCDEQADQGGAGSHIEDIEESA